MTTATMENGVTVRRVSRAELRDEVAEAVLDWAGLTMDEFERLGRDQRLEGELLDLWRLVRDLV
jgi:hypothetical protein